MDILKKLFPFLAWFPFKGSTLRADAIAGITVALVLIPQSMAYAQLAGLPPYFGLYAACLPVAVAAMFGSSKQLATGPVAVVSLLTASALTPYAMVGSPEIIDLAIITTLLVGGIQLLLGIFRLGALVNFLSHPVIMGFTNAAAIIIALSQLSKMFGVKMGRSHSFMQDIWGVLRQLGETHWPTLAFGLSALIIMFTLKRYRPKLPNVLIAVAVTTIISWLIGFEKMGGAVVGGIPSGLPSITPPKINIDMIMKLLPNALIISLVGFMEAISIAKAMAAKTKDRIDPNQELIGQGLANFLGSFTQSYPCSGSFSRSAVNLDAGAKTGLSSVFTALIIVVTLLFLTPLLHHLPQAALAAVIMMAVSGLINVKGVKHAWRASRHDGVAAGVTFIATLVVAPHLDGGIMIGAGLAIVLYLYRTMHPRVAHLGRFDDGTLRDVGVYPELPTDPRIILIRFDGSLYFANVSYFEDNVLAAVANKPNAKFFLVVGDGINQLDASGEEVLHKLAESLRSHGITLMFSGLKRQVIEVMHRTGLYDFLGGRANVMATEDVALAEIYKRMGGEGEFCPLLPREYDQKKEIFDFLSRQ